MAETYTDLLIHIRNRPDEDSPYPVEASLSDGSFFFGHLHLSEEALSQAELQADFDGYGRSLFEALLAGPIGRAYDLAAGMARDESGGQLRVRLWLDKDATRLQAIKWERIAHYYNGQLLPLSTTGETPFSRYTGLGIAEPRPIRQRPLKVLVAIANPSDLKSSYGLEPIDVAREVKSLRQALGDLQKNRQIEVTILPGQSGLPPKLADELLASGYQIEDRRTSVGNLMRRLDQFHIFHFLGHGVFRAKEDDGTAALFLEKPDGSCEVVKDLELAEKIQASDQIPHLFFLAACESAKTGIGQAFVGLGPKLVQAGVPAVVAMQDKIAMDDARQLTADFYDRLLQHGLVDKALNEARNLLRQQNSQAWATPVLFMRLKTGQLFAADPYQVALEAMSHYEKFSFFSHESGRYIPMPIEVIHLTGHQDTSNLNRLEQQASATIEVLKAIEDTITGPDPEQGERPRLAVLLGGFGSNKSTQLKRVTWETIRQSLANPWQRRLPVYVDLQSYQPVRSTLENPIEGEVLNVLAEFWPELKVDKLADLPTHPQLRILFYGTDSLADPDRAIAIEQIVNLMRDYPRYEYVLASRPAAIIWSDYQEEIDLHLLVIQPMNPTRIRHFLENLESVSALGDVSPATRKRIGRRLLKQLYHSQLFDLVATPRFMLEMLRQGSRGAFPTSRTNALHIWVEGSLALIAPGQGMRARAAETIYSLAWEMQRARHLVWPVSEAFRIIDQVRGSRGYDLETLYRNFLEHDLLNEVGETSLRFAYSPVQAYCCAKAIVNKADRSRILGDIAAMLGSPSRLRWWEETLVFVCGLMSEQDEIEALRELLTRIIYGSDLLEGEQVFLAARSLLECQQHQRDLADLHGHVVNSLRWRMDSQNEPRSASRVLATQLLSRLAEPEAIVHLAELVYKKARKNLDEMEDYEYSSVRLAAAIGLKRMKSRQQVDETLAGINPVLVTLFFNWENGDEQALIEHFSGSDDAGIRSAAALALGDLASQATLSQVKEERKAALDCLVDSFQDESIPSSVRWAVTDALAMVDTTTISIRVLRPALGAIKERDPSEQDQWLGRDKCLAYLIGLIRAQEPAAHDFLVDHCLSIKDMRLWLTALEALGKLANLEDRQLLVDIAAGNICGQSLAEKFPDSGDRDHIRRKAIEVLGEIGDANTAKALHEEGVGLEEPLTQSYYEAISEIYQRLE